jgi:hypothetical protein
MVIEVFSACDFAQDNHGKLTVVGAFDAINVKAFPAAHPLLCVAVRMRFFMHELGRHAVKVETLAPSGEAVIPPFEGSVDINNIGSDSTAINLVISHIGLRLNEPGKHELRLSVDGDPVGSLPLYVQKI